MRRPLGAASRDDAVGTHIEAMVLALFAFTALAMVEQLAPAEPSVPTAAYHPVLIDADTVLGGLERLPTQDHYNHALDKAIAKAYMHNTTDLDAQLRRALPAGAGYRFWLDNGHARKLLAGPAETGIRQSVSATHLYHPDWSYVANIPDVDVVPPGMAMPFHSIAVAQGALLEEAGIPIVVNLTTTNGTYTASFITSFATGPSASITLQGSDGTQGYAWTDPSVLPNVTTPIYDDTQNGPPRSPASFAVPTGSLAINISASSTGTGSSYTLTLTEPDRAAQHTYSVSDLTPLNAILRNPTAGAWSLTAGAGPVPPSASTVDITSIAPQYNADWNVTVNETAGADLPEGSMLVVQFPAPFNATGLNTTQAGWRDITWRAAPDGGSILQASLATPLSGGTRSFTAHANRGAVTSSAWYMVRAWMNTTSTTSRSTFLISGVNALGVPASNPLGHQFYISGPKPMTPGAWQNWAFVFTYPSAVSNPTVEEDIVGVDVWAPHGEAVFGRLTDRQWQNRGAGRLRWTPPNGYISVHPNEVKTIPLTFLAQGPTTSTEPSWQVPIAFDNGYADAFIDQSDEPYVFSGAFPPASSAGGRDGSTVNVADGPVNVTSAMYARHALLTGRESYNVSHAAPLATYAEALKLGLLESTLSIDKTTLRVGDSAAVSVNFTGLLERMGNGMNTWSISIDVYDPAQPFEPMANWTSQLSDTHVFPNAVPKNAKYSTTFTASADEFYGPHIAIARGHFELPDTGHNVPVTVRRVGVVNVVPDGGQAETALYWVILEAWMPDWT